MSAVAYQGHAAEPTHVRTGVLVFLGMAERMALAGGSFSLESRPGGGTRVIARVTVPGRAS